MGAKLIVVVLNQQGAIVTIPGADGRPALPTTFVDDTEPVDLPTMIRARELFGWHVAVGGVVHGDQLESGMQRQVVSAFFDSDRPSCGPVPDTSITRVHRNRIPAIITDHILANAATDVLG